jgi:hypothetical protein
MAGLSEEDVQHLSKEDSKAGRLQRACLILLREHEEDGAIPTSIRFLFYELLDQGVIPKAYYDEDGKERRRTPSQDISDAVTVLRESGLVPWSWIVDETRTLHDRRYAESVYWYMMDTLPRARIDLWDGRPPPLILCESRSLAGVLQETATEYLCPITATNGQVGGFLHNEVAPLITETGKRRVLYLGDLDLSGGHIEENTFRVLAEYGYLDWAKVAITGVQVRKHDFPRKWKKDKRFKPPRWFQAVETEALGQTEIVRLLTEKLDELVPEPLEEVLEREEQQRVLVRKLLRGEGDREEEEEEDG